MHTKFEVRVAHFLGMHSFDELRVSGLEVRIALTCYLVRGMEIRIARILGARQSRS